MSPERAAKDYSVIVKPETFELDREETEKLRKEMG